MRVNVMGTIAVEGDSGESLTVTSPRLRLVLSILAANHGTTVAADRLIDLIWPDSPPASASTSLQVSISQLRKLFEPNRAAKTSSSYLHTVGNGYRLDLATSQLDLAMVRSAIEQVIATPTDDAMKTLREVWATPIFADYFDASWALPVIETLRESRLSAIVEHATGAIHDGRPDKVLPSLTAELAADPYEERVAGLLMMAYLRQDRQVDALAVYKDMRIRLRDDLGLEPTLTLRNLERAVLEQHPVAHNEHESRAVVPPPSRRATSFIGRDDDVNRVVDLIGSSMLVTIVGPPGVGKTRLADEVAARTLRRRIHRIDLSNIVEADRVLDAIAHAIGIDEPPATPLVEAITAVLRQEPTLVILDNCEHLLEAASSAANTLCGGADIDPAEDVVILATSRRLLNLSTEAAVRLHPLELPPLDATVDQALATASCELLADRAGLTIDDTNVAAIVEICHRLDGLPLALELGAYRARSSGPDGLARDLTVERNITGPADLYGAHRSLDALVSTSVAGLDDVANDVLSALAICAAAVPVAVVQAMLREHGAEVVALAVSDLVERHLVTTTRLPSPEGPPSTAFGLLDTVRAYTRRQLDQAERNSRRDRHATVIADIVRRSRDEGASARPRLGDVVREVAHALDHLEATAQDGALHHQFLGGIGSFWYRSGRHHEALERLDKAVALYPSIDPLWRGTTLATAGLMSFSSGRFRDVDRYITEALDQLAGVDLPGLDLLRSARAVSRQELDEVERLIFGVLASGDIAGLHRAVALDIAAYSAWYNDDLDLAVERLTLQEREAGDIDDRFLQGRAIRGRGLMLAYQGHTESGALLCQQSADLITDWEADRSVTQVLATRAAIHFMADDHAQARQDAIAGMRRALHRFDGVPMLVAVPTLTSIETHAGRHESAARTSGWVRAICATTNMAPPPQSLALLVEAESASRAALGDSAWAAARAAGASDGVHGLVAHLTA